MRRIIFLTIITVALNISSSKGQNYTSNYNSIYRLNQSSNGLAYPSSSYISPGTLSKTAQQGAGYNIQSNSNPNLPKVNRGSYFGTPGDNLYSGNPDLAQTRKLIKIQKPITTANKSKEPDLHTYTPDPNIPMTYSDFNPKSTPPENTDGNTVNSNK